MNFLKSFENTSNHQPIEQGRVAVALARLVSALLVAVSPADPLVYFAAAAFTVLTALAAVAIPAWRALRVDPAVALRTQ